MSIPIRSRRARAAGAACGAVALGLSLAGASQAGTLALNSVVEGGVLTATSTAADPIAITCDGAGQLLVNGKNPDSGAFKCAELTGIVVNGGPGDNAIDLGGIAAPAVSATLPVTVRGGAGNDTITGSALADKLFGEAGNDTITGFRGADTVDGGDDGDTMIWNNGDGSDVNEGGPGNDTAVVNGAPAGDAFTVNPNGNRVRFDRTNLVPFSIDIGTTERLRLNGLGGDDTMDGSANPGLGALIRTEMNGGDGNDTLTGTDGNDTLNGGPGNDRLVGFRGADDVNGGDGDDTMVWNNGDGSDVNDGDAGNDTTQVNGAATQGDTFRSRPGTGGRVRFDRTNLVPFSIDIGTTERLDVNGGGGDDDIAGARGLARLIALDLDGQDGNDALRGGDGRDVLTGGNGNDAIRAADRRVDQVDCGAGRDRAQVDRIDRVRGCEAVNRQPDRVKPDIRLQRPVFDRRAIRVVVTCPRSEWRCTGLLGFRRAGSRLGSSRIAVGGGSRKTFRLRLTASGKRQLRGERRLRATARYTVTDGSGNKRRKNVRVVLRRA